MFKYLNKVNNIPLKYKFLLIYIVCILLPIITLNIIFFTRISNNIKDRENENIQISMDRAVSEINKLIEGCITVSNFIYIDQLIYDMSDTDFPNEADYYKFFDKNLRNRLNKYITIYNNISDLSVYTSNSTIKNGDNYHYIDNNIINSPRYNEYLKNNNSIFLYSYFENDNLNPGSYIQYLSIIRELNKFSTKNRPNILKINIDINKIYEILDQEESYLRLFLIDDKNRIVFSTGRLFETNTRGKLKSIYDIDLIEDDFTKNNFLVMRII